MANYRKNIQSQDKFTSTYTYCFLQSLKAFITNINFNIHHYLQKDLIKQINQHSQHHYISNTIYCLGKPIQDVQQFVELQDQLIWITYRKKFYLTDSINSDNGWGCLLRVAQMALANFILHLNESNSLGLTRKEIIGEFIQQGKGAYRMVSLLKEGKALWHKEAGNWFSMNEMILMLQSLQQKQKIDKLSNFKIKAYNETINIDEIIQNISDKNELIIDQHIINNQIPYRQQRDNKIKRSVLLMVTVNFTNNVVTREEYQGLLYLMQLKIFRGILGGVQDQARFITGKYGSKLIYLDPHYVQDSIPQQNLQTNLQTYKCKQYRYMQRQELDINMAICFQIKNKQDIKILKSAINNINRVMNMNMKNKNVQNNFINYQQSKFDLEIDQSQMQIDDEIYQIQLLKRLSSEEIQILM